MNSISVLPPMINHSIEDQMSLNNDLMKRDIFFVENSTNNDNSPSEKNSLKIIIPFINPKLFSNKKKNKKSCQDTILDFDKVLSILMKEKVPKKKKKKNSHKSKDHCLLNKKTNRSSQLKKKSSLNNGKKIKAANNSLYSIDNFFSNSMKIVEKKEFVHIECPKYTEIPQDSDIEINESECSDMEDISDGRYFNLHKPLEDKELNLRIKLCSNDNDKRKSNKPYQKADEKPKTIKKKHSTLSHTDSTIDEKHFA